MPPTHLLGNCRQPRRGTSRKGEISESGGSGGNGGRGGNYGGCGNGGLCQSVVMQSLMIVNCKLLIVGCFIAFTFKFFEVVAFEGVFDELGEAIGGAGETGDAEFADFLAEFFVVIGTTTIGKG